MSGPNFLRNWQHTHRQRKHPHLYEESNDNKTKPSQVSSSVKGVAPSGGQQTIKGAFQAKLNPNSPRALYKINRDVYGSRSVEQSPGIYRNPD